MIKASDMYGLPVSNSGKALDVWQQGLSLADSFDASGITELGQAVELAPDFAIAHAALAKQQMFHGFFAGSQASLSSALALTNSVTEREASLIHVLNATLNFQANGLEIALAHIDHWPLDKFVFSLIVGPFGLLAFSGQREWREQCLALLEHHRHRWPQDDWWYLSALAFSHAECGTLKQAQELGDRAWALSANGNCTHTLSHVYKEQCDTPKGLELLKTHLQGTQTQSDMRHHLVWHFALLELESGTADQASMEHLYRTEFDPNAVYAMPLDIYADNASILWRCLLKGIPLDSSFAEQTLSFGKQKFPELGFGFADMHRVLLTALVAHDEDVLALRNAISQQGTRSYLENLLSGAIAFTQGDFRLAKERFGPLLNDTVLLGGSNPQRGVIAETYQAILNHE